MIIKTTSEKYPEKTMLLNSKTIVSVRMKETDSVCYHYINDNMKSESYQMCSKSIIIIETIKSTYIMLSISSEIERNMKYIENAMTGASDDIYLMNGCVMLRK